ncbi:MAG: signal peptidase I [Acidimicrobiales bacterium]
MDDDGSAGIARQHRRRGLVSWLVIVAVAVVVAVVLRQFVVQTFYVPSGSMIPTLLPGDRILVQKIGYSIQEGAVVVFKTPPGYRPSDCGGTAESDLVKRVIGLPGETIKSVGNVVYINGRKLPEPYLPKGLTLGAAIPPQKVPPGKYFVMGDNRPVSCDSRVWGLVPRSDIVGRVFLVIWRHGRPDFGTF